MMMGSAQLRAAMSQQGKMGGVVSEEDVRRSERWHGQIRLLQGAWQGLKMAITAPIQNALQPMLESLTAYVQRNLPVIREKIAELGRTATDKFYSMAMAAIDCRQSIMAVASVLGPGMLGAAVGSLFGPWGKLTGLLVGSIGGFKAMEPLVKTIGAVFTAWARRSRT